MYNVNLVFHGVFAFVLNPDTIDVVFPYFSPHEYLFGCWGDLEPLGKGDLHVVGLQGISHCRPYPDFSPDQSATVANFNETCDDNLFCTVKLKHYPSSVHLFRPYAKPLDKNGVVISRFPFSGVHGQGLNPSALAGPIVFCYQATCLEDVQIVYRKKPLKFNRNPESDSETMNLHFFAEGEKDLPQEGDLDRPPQVSVHYQNAWTRLVSTIASLDIRLGQLWPFVLGHTQPLPPKTGVPGLPPEQLADLDEIFNAVHHPGPNTFGGDTDCDKAHLVVDNRPALRS